MIDVTQLQKYVIDPTLEAIEMYSPEASDLVLVTGYVESRYKYLVQVGGGPARSFWQVEPFTAHDIFQTYLKYRPEVDFAVKQLMTKGPVEEQLLYNLPFAIAMCRIKYRRSPKPLPQVGDVEAQAHIWKQDYNTAGGAGTEEKFIQMVNEFKKTLNGV